MGQFDNMITDMPSMNIENSIFLRAQVELKKNEKQKERRNLFQWLTVPLAASVIGALYLKSKQHSESIPDESFATNIPLEVDDNIELIAELDVLENLEDLEGWEDV